MLPGVDGYCECARCDGVGCRACGGYGFVDAHDERPYGGSLSIGATIRQRRKRCNVTQSEVARRTNMKQATISAIENGRENLSLRTLKRLARALQLDLALCIGENVLVLNGKLSVVMGRSDTVGCAGTPLRELSGTPSPAWTEIGSQELTGTGEPCQ